MVMTFISRNTNRPIYNGCQRLGGFVVTSHPGEKRGLRMLCFTFTAKYMYACINVLRKAAILVVDQITVDNFAFYFS